MGSYVIANDGTRIYYERFSPDEGSARRGGRPSEDVPPALLVNGLAASGRLWAPAVRRLLGAGYEAIAVDNRGCGRSSTPWRPWTTRRMAADAVAVLDDLGVEQAHVGGVSLGGMVAQELALEFPERASTLVLLSTTGGLRRLDLAAPSGLLHLAEAALRSRRAGDDIERQVSAFLCMGGSEDFAARCRPGDETWDAVAAMLEDPISERGVALQLLATMRHSTWSRLPRLKVPVQVHHGSRDPLVPPAHGRELARRIPNARFEFHPGAGHGVVESMEEVSGSILSFLGESEAGKLRPTQLSGSNRRSNRKRRVAGVTNVGGTRIPRTRASSAPPSPGGHA